MVTYTVLSATDGSTVYNAVRDQYIQNGVKKVADAVTDFNAITYGAVCDDTTNDATAVQAAISACSAAGGGTVTVPGRCAVGSTLTVPSNVIIRGMGKQRSWLRSTTTAVLLSLSGSSSASHISHAGVSDITLNGNGTAGALLRTYYADNLLIRGVQFTSVLDRALDGVELWDSYVTDCVFESCGGTSGTQPAIHIRNATTTTSGAFGYSTDNSNMVWLSNIRVEGFRDGAIWVEKGAGSNNPNGIFLTNIKAETHNTRGKPIYIDDSVQHVHLKDVEVYVGSFDSGVTTAVPGIIFNSPGPASARDIRIVANDGAGNQLSDGMQVYTGIGPMVIDNVSVLSAGMTGAGIYNNGGPGTLRISNLTVPAGVTRIAGTLPPAPVDAGGAVTARDCGYLGMNFDPAALSTTSTPLTPAGTLFVAAVRLDFPARVTNLHLFVQTAGAGLTAGRNLLGLFTAAGVLLSACADQSTPWASTGLKTAALTAAQELPAGIYYVAYYATGTTLPAFARSGATQALNGALAAASSRWATSSTGLTTALPGTFGTLTASAVPYWAALS